MAYDHLTIISGRAHPELAREIAEYLGIKLAAIEIGDFPDGEISVKLNQNIRGCDVYIVQPTGPPVNRNIMELLILIDTCRRASAAPSRPCSPISVTRGRTAKTRAACRSRPSSSPT